MSISNPINPDHYKKHPSGIECIDIAEKLGFNLGNAFKYVYRRENKENEIQDLKKSIWYLNREILNRNIPEIWMIYPNNENYLVSSLGNVKHINSSKIRKLILIKNGYLTFLAKQKGKDILYYAHRVVYETFIGEIKHKQHISHLNGNKKNNQVNNLKATNAKENSSHKKFHNTELVGERGNTSKLNENQIEEIRSLNGVLSETKISKIYNVSRGQINRIHRFINWKKQNNMDTIIKHEKNENIKSFYVSLWDAYRNLSTKEDLEKAIWYLNREIKKLTKKRKKNLTIDNKPVIS